MDCPPVALILFNRPDLTQQVFERMLRSIRGYQPRGAPFASWLFRIAHNMLVDRVRRGLRTAVRHRPRDARALVPGLVLGDTSGLADDLVAAFRVTGLTHVSLRY